MTGIGQRVYPVVGEEDDQAIIVAGAYLAPVCPPVGRVHLGEPGLEPPRLIAVDASIGPPAEAVGVQRDEPGGRRVMDVVRRAVEPVLLTEPVPERAGARLEMRLDEVPPGDRPAAWIGSDGLDRAGHEGLRPLGEQLQRTVMVEVGRQPERLLAADQRIGQGRG